MTPRTFLLAAAALLAACGSTPRRDLDFDRLHASLQALGADPALARLALAERALAEAAVRRLDASSVNAEEHAQLAYLAERRVDIAYIAAQTERERGRLVELQGEHAALLLAASRRETAAMRAELDRQRQRELQQQEDMQRGALAGTPPVAAPPSSTPVAPAIPGAAAQTQAANPVAIAPAPAPPRAEAAAVAGAETPPVAAATPDTAAAAPGATPAAPPPAAGIAGPAMPAPGTASALAQRLAVLLPEAGPSGEQMTLEDLVFEPGTAEFVADASVGLARVAAWLRSVPVRAVRVAGHTDATGSPEANRSLSLRRAEAVRAALVDAGVDAARISVSGEGAAQPVASNDDPAGRARNRRVVVLVAPAGS